MSALDHECFGRSSRRFVILIDVGYLYAAAAEVLLGVTSRREYKVDAEKLIRSLIDRATNLMPTGELLRVYWFDAARDRVPTVRTVVDVDAVRDEALDLMRALLAHRHRGAELLYEAYQVDISAGD